LVQEAPLESVHYGYLGDARSSQGDVAGAREAYARAVELLPSYAYAASRLADLQLDGGEVDAARETVERVRYSASPDEVEALLVRIEARAQRGDAALDALDQLLSLPASQHVLELALDALLRSGVAAQALRRVEDALL